MDRIYRSAFLSLAINIAFGAYNIAIGFTTRSLWLFTIGTYYAILSVIRYTVLRSKNNSIVKKLTGIFLMVMSLPLAGTVVLASIQDRGITFNEIVMITLAVYSFTKITIASINLVKSKRSRSVKIKILRNISFADAFVSIFSLQRSMLVSFGEMPKSTIRIMNIATGSAICMIVFLLGVNLLRKTTAKSPQNSDKGGAINMSVKLISVDTNSCFFHRLTDNLNEKVNEWLDKNPNIELISVTPTFNNVNDDNDDNVVIMTATIIYNESCRFLNSK